MNATTVGLGVMGIVILILLVGSTFIHAKNSDFSVVTLGEATSTPVSTSISMPAATGVASAASPSQASKTPNSWKGFITPSDAQLRATLTPLQYEVTQKDGTEQAYNNEYFDTHADGIYVDRVSGEPLYSSKDKYESGTGWPSFVKPIAEGVLTFKTDGKLIFQRTEVRSRIANSHLGHVFDDGPQDRGGKRYCMNSAALRFIPKASMKAEGYGDYLEAV